MTSKQLDKFRTQLRDLAVRVQGTADSLEAQVRVPTGGEAGGNLSNAPMHLGDVGSEVYTQELNATLLENEAYIRDETLAALDRVEAGTFGKCEGCAAAIPAARLDALPYTRYCVRCAEKVQAGVAVNINDGRPRSWSVGSAPDGAEADAVRNDDRIPAVDREGRDRDALADTHAAGTPGGGTAVGGLAGTTLGDGDPADAGLEHAMGSGNFDVALEGEQDDATPYAGQSGGAVGGTPAGKRAAGGKSRRATKK
jgi:RNA polymerase-binding transcription factor DksA